MKILGAHLGLKLQAECKARFVHRFTGEHRPEWTKKNPSCAMQFLDDADWLSHTYFEITKQGELSKKAHYCESHPTWPNNPELRKP